MQFPFNTPNNAFPDESSVTKGSPLPPTPFRGEFQRVLNPQIGLMGIMDLDTSPDKREFLNAFNLLMRREGINMEATKFLGRGGMGAVVLVNK